MRLRKNVFRRRKIKAKDRAQIEWVTGMFFVLMLSILLYTQLQLAAWHSASADLEDALAASNLAAALIDVREYGRTHRVYIPDAEAAYAIFQDAARDNLQLNEQWESVDQALIAGVVEIADFVVYNVKENHVEAVRVGDSGQAVESWSGIRGQLRAPNGVTVENTGIYSEICFPVEGFPGMEVQAHKGKLVDIAAVKGEEDEKR